MLVRCLQLRPRGARESKEEGLAYGLEKVAASEADLVVLPELWVTGYFGFARYREEAEPLSGAIVRALCQLARKQKLYLAGGSIVERGRAGRLYNTSVLIDPRGEVALRYRKHHLFGYRSQEVQLLQPGTTIEVVETPLGRVTLTTCYDLRFPELYRLLVEKGAELVLVPAAWPRARVEHWRLLTRTRALENQVFLVACNGAGIEGRVELAGESVIVDPWGTVVARAGEKEEVLAAELEPKRLSSVRREFPVLRDRRLRVWSAPRESARQS